MVINFVLETYQRLESIYHDRSSAIPDFVCLGEIEITAFFCHYYNRLASNQRKAVTKKLHFNIMFAPEAV